LLSKGIFESATRAALPANQARALPGFLAPALREANEAGKS
jgi:hypothetical protein